jgi:ribonuclease HI
MGCGCIIKKGNKYLLKEGFRLASDGYAVTTNNIAEHFALNNILRKLIELGLQKESILVYGDSNLVIQQMSGKWMVKKGYYKETAEDNILLLANFTNIAFQWIPREQNTQADELSSKYAPAFVNKKTGGFYAS